MGSLVKLSTPTRIAQQLKLSLQDGVNFRPTTSYLGLELSGEPEILIQSGNEEGSKAISSELTRSRYRISLGFISPSRYHALIEWNPLLAGLGTAGGTRFVEPGEDTELLQFFKPFTNCDLTILPWYARIYLLD